MSIANRILWLWLASYTPFAVAGLADDMNALLIRGEAAKAYALGLSQPGAWGQPDVDLAFGIAAAESGHADQAVMALERYLMQHPDDNRGRIEYARALYLAGDHVQAETLFLEHRRTTDNPTELASIDNYLNQLRQRQSRGRPQWSGHIEIGASFDNNVNGGINHASVTLPALGNITLSEAGVRQHDTVGLLDAGIRGSYPLGADLHLVGTLAGTTRAHRTHETLDQRSYLGSGGLAWFMGDHSVSAHIAREQLDLDGRRFRLFDSITGMANLQIDPFQAITLALVSGETHYGGDNRLRDSRINSLNLGWRRNFPLPLQPGISLSAGIGTEQNQQNRPDLGRDFSSLRLAGTIVPAPDWTVGGSLTWRESQFRGGDPTFQMTREDTFRATEINLGYRLDRQWSLRGQLLDSHNQSNIALYDYRRRAIEVRLRYDF